jgi:hypothetical protein
MSALGHKRTLRLVSGHQQTHRRSPLYAISGSRHNQIGIMTSPDAPLGLRKGTQNPSAERATVWFARDRRGVQTRLAISVINFFKIASAKVS